MATSDRDVVVRRLRRSLLALSAVILVGTVGYFLLGFSPLDAVYQTVTTVTTIGFREVQPFGTAEKVFTILFVLVGVGVVLYTLSALLGLLIEGWAGNEWGRRRMEKEIEDLHGHAIVCGWGRVGRAAAHQLHKSGQSVVVCDTDGDRLDDCPYPHLEGDATRDEFMRRLGVERAKVLVATLDTDASSLFVTLTARALNADLVIIARSRVDDTEQKLLRAGADRVVNPQRIGGNRIAAFALQPHVTDFLDVAMHDEEVEFRLEQVVVHDGSSLAGSSVRETRLHEGDGALLLALRQSEGGVFRTNPSPDAVVKPGDVVIVIGTAAQIDAVRRDAGSRKVRRG
ncbi:MAG TPA: TrkA family potassium uptake protein [Dermatophilaceae bacterium]|nr:TrkA family potassium uptake protein [Dermatophilaceae bacterium]